MRLTVQSDGRFRSQDQFLERVDRDRNLVDQRLAQSALLHLTKEPRVLDGDGRLVGERTAEAIKIEIGSAYCS
jgi:hypothetical protein